MSRIKNCLDKIKVNRLDFNQDKLLQQELDLIDQGVDPVKAARQVALSFHKQLFTELNDLKKEVGLPEDEYQEPVYNTDAVEEKYTKISQDTENKRTELKAAINDITSKTPVIQMSNTTQEPVSVENEANIRQQTELSANNLQEGAIKNDDVNDGTTEPLSNSEQLEVNQLAGDNTKTEGVTEGVNEPTSVDQLADDILNEINSEASVQEQQQREQVIKLGRQLQSAWAKYIPGLKTVTENYDYEVRQAVINGEITGDYTKISQYPGFYNPSTNTVYLNPAKVGTDTPIHEFGHVWHSIAQQTEKGRKVLEQGYKLIENSEYLKAIQAMPEYQFWGESEEDKLRLQKEEALITAIGNRGADFVDKAAQNQFLAWLSSLLDSIGIMVKKLKGKDLSKLTLDQYLDLAAADIISGGEILINEYTPENAFDGGKDVDTKLRTSVASTRRVEKLVPDIQKRIALAETLEPEEAFKQTGLSKGIGGDWQIELDYKASLKPDIHLPLIKKTAQQTGKKDFKLSEVLNYPQLFMAYPELRDVLVRFVDHEDSWAGSASLDGKKVHLNLSDDMLIYQEEQAYRNGYKEPDAVDRAYVSTLIHEAQHLIQRIEGWPGGFNTFEAFNETKKNIASFFQQEGEATNDKEYLDYADKVKSFDYFDPQDNSLYEQVYNAAVRRYQASAGEQQAKNTQTRYLNPELRTQTLEQTETVSRDSQVNDRIRLSVGKSGLDGKWSEEAIDLAQRLLYDGSIQITENTATGPAGYTVSYNGRSINAETKEDAEKLRDKIIHNVLLKKYTQINPWIAENIVERAKVKNIFKPIPKNTKPGVSIPVEVKPYIADSRTRKQRYGEAVSRFFKEYFTSTRGMDKVVFDLRRRKNGTIDYLVNEAESLVKELKARAKATGFDDWKTFDEELRNANTITPGNPYGLNQGTNTMPQIELPSKLPKEMEVYVAQMRAIIDGISEQLIRNGHVTPDLALTIQMNMGKYIHRSYAMFTMGNEWAKQLKEDPEKQFILQNAKEHLTQMFAVNIRAVDPQLTNEEISLQANEEADKEIDRILKTRKSFFGTDEGSFLPYRNTGSLKARAELPQWLRDMLGEYTDPGTAFLLSVSETTQLLHTSLYLADLRKVGMGKFLFETNNRPREASYQINVPAKSAIYPLSGLWTTKEMYDHLMATEQATSGAWKTFLKVVNLNKTFKTIFSPGTQVKNFLNNSIFALSNANLNKHGWKQARSYLKSQVTGSKKLSDAKELEQLFVRGLLSQNITARELNNIFKSDDYEQYILDSANVEKTFRQGLLDIVTHPLDKANDLWRKSLRWSGRVYQASDAFWKIQAFFSERSKLSGVMYDKSYETLSEKEKSEVDNEAADRVMNTYPSYDRALKAFMISSKIPVLGNFTAFKAEMYRTMYHQYKYAITDTIQGIKEGNHKKTAMGLERMLGTITHNGLRIGTEYLFAKALGYGVSGVSAILANLLPGLGGADEDEEKELLETRSGANKFTAGWARSDDKVFDLSKVSENGDITYWIGSNLDPTQGIYNIINAYADGNEYYSGGVAAAGTEFVMPFLEPEMTARVFMESIVGFDDKGRKLYMENDKPLDKAGKGALYIARNVMIPGFVNLGDKIFTVRDEDGNKSRELNKDELWGIVGMKPYKSNIKFVFSNAVRSQENLTSDISRQFNKEFKEGDDYTEKANRQFREGVANLRDMYIAAIKLGYPQQELNEILKSSRIGKRAKAAIVTGNDPGDAWDAGGKVGSKYRPKKKE